MKLPALFVIPASVLLLIPSCRREAPVEEAEAGGKAAEEQLAMERWQLARERAALQEELAEFDRRLQADVENANERTEEFDKKKEELAGQAKALGARERALAEREAELMADPAEPAEGEVGLEAALAAEPVQEFVENPLPPLEEVDLPAVSDYGMFYDDLSPHGDWYETSDYGYIWRPTVVVQVNNWRPYCNGRWVWTDCGWTWVSNEPFGWATYHYGRWTLLPGHGWVWVPGHCWAPAWVCWRQGGSHIGWAPLPPECADGMRPLWGSTVEREFGIGADWFCFVRTEHFAGDLGSHCLPRRENRLVLSGTTNVTLIHERRGRIISGGPDFENLCGRLGRRLPQLTLDLDRLGNDRRSGVVSGDRLLVTAPTVDADWNALLKPKRLSGRIDRPADPRHSRASVLGAIERISAHRVQDRRRAEEQFQKLSPDRFEEHRAQLLARQREVAMTEIRRHDGRVSSAVAGDRRAGKPAADVGRTGAAPTMTDIPRRVASGDGMAGEATGAGTEAASQAQDRSKTTPAISDRRSGPAVTPGDQSEPKVAGNTGRTVARPGGVRPAGDAAVASGRRGRLQEAAATRRLQEQETAMRQQQAQQARLAEEERKKEVAETARRGQEEAMQRQREQARVAESARQQRDAEEALRGQREQAMQAQQAEQQRVQAEAQRRAQQQEQARRVQEEARRRAQEEAMRQQQEEARRAQAEAQRQAQQEAMRQQQEQARRAQEDAQRRAQEEAMRQQQQEQARQAREAAQRQAEEASRRQAQEAAQRQAEEASRRQAQEAAQRQAEEASRRQAQEAAQRQRAADRDRSSGRR